MGAKSIFSPAPTKTALTKKKSEEKKVEKKGKKAEINKKKDK